MDQPYDKSTYQILRPVCTQDIVVSINKFGVAVGANQVPEYSMDLVNNKFKGPGNLIYQGVIHPKGDSLCLLVYQLKNHHQCGDTTMYDAKSWPEITEHHRYLQTHPQAFGLMFVLFSEVFAGVFGT
ncbi:hypothetical protein SERLADRAFT_410102 [Serpula lacrymans var. lacrymans S7.9]|uniref:Uncharacterized protein n=1 Tax=Serpula lacrymans var. lacrymans (strain S7.9) TaxID=578457 RepID=F8P4A5_SERL9|nr:uncharacterized protein SERLADRAFT_410102 [Serpula lacrymans var. lacrymans S7.9]EGO21443.1 hypothetical protein SERLADRAFT_410102 [Serpula lacrymans var. lacrymans S7.9]